VKSFKKHKDRLNEYLYTLEEGTISKLHESKDIALDVLMMMIESLHLNKGEKEKNEIVINEIA